MTIKVVFFISIFPLFLCGDENKKKGVTADGAIGLPTVTLTNPDNTKAHYSGFSLLGRAVGPIIDTAGFDLNLIASIRYLDLQNTANTSTQKEIANYIGAGPGLQLRLWKIFGGVEYLYSVGRHYSVGAVSKDIQFDFQSFNFYYGFVYSIGKLKIQLSSSQATGSLPKDKIHLQNNAPYSDQIYWLHATYSTGYSFFAFIESLFSK